MNSRPSTRTATRRNPLARLLSDHYAQGTVTEVDMVTATMVRVRIHSEEVPNWDYTPGQHVRVQINDPLSLYGIFRPGETLRTYTIWDRSVEKCEFELRAHLYGGDGIGLSWLRNVAVGDELTYWGPQGDFAVKNAQFHLFAVEETGACGIAPLLRELPAQAQVYGVIESASPDDEPPVPGPHRLGRAYRGTASAASSEVLLAAVKQLDLPTDGGAAYLVGEARTCQAIRSHLLNDRGWDRKAIIVKPFWTPGKRGLHH
ncbi:siderophore-interacting protein [Natronoglycomyces albus]|uniref:Siderophore-interacting protein n=1 Tax=Natronoglycomyces albus TaxID=2811108 RepID=A0A895XTD9_9ACTN|nr:siderophore-interacting protein [Natronoglycomyces albus]QSB04898.1 siderophore-interacting protein [Natronoglycomyces albus]